MPYKDKTSTKTPGRAGEDQRKENQAPLPNTKGGNRMGSGTKGKNKIREAGDPYNLTA